MRQLIASVVVVVSSAGCSVPKPPPGDPAQATSAPSSVEPHASGRKVGGPCTSDSVPGVGTVTQIEDDTTAGADCKSAKKVTVSFAPNDAAARAHRLDSGFTLDVGGVEFVATGCVEEHKIVVGAKLDVVRHILTSGTCSPVTYEVKELSSPEAIEKCVAHCR